MNREEFNKKFRKEFEKQLAEKVALIKLINNAIDKNKSFINVENNRVSMVVCVN